jgi:hypothetical protein
MINKLKDRLLSVGTSARKRDRDCQSKYYHDCGSDRDRGEVRPVENENGHSTSIISGKVSSTECHLFQRHRFPRRSTAIDHWYGTWFTGKNAY